MSLRLLLLSLLLAGCTGGAGLPRPPGVLGVPRASVSNGVQVVRCESVDTPKTVNAFYADKVGRHPGWTSSGSEITFYSNNLAMNGDFESYKAKDPKKPGQGVLVMPGRDSGSQVFLVTAEPKK